MARKFRIRHQHTGYYLGHIYLGPRSRVPVLHWTKYESAALQFDTDEEVRSTIDFIVNVINWELDGELTIW